MYTDGVLVYTVSSPFPADLGVVGMILMGREILK